MNKEEQQQILLEIKIQKMTILIALLLVFGLIFQFAFSLYNYFVNGVFL